MFSAPKRRDCTMVLFGPSLFLDARAKGIVSTAHARYIIVKMPTPSAGPVETCPLHVREQWNT